MTFALRTRVGKEAAQPPSVLAGVRVGAELVLAMVREHVMLMTMTKRRSILGVRMLGRLHRRWQGQEAVLELVLRPS